MFGQDKPFELEVVDVVVDVEQLTLPELATEINRLHNDAEGHARSAVECAWYAGQALLEAKGRCAHGEWLPWLEKNFTGSKDSANDYMRLAKKEHAPFLEGHTTIRGALAAIAESKPKRERKPKPKVVDTAGNEQPAPAQEPVPVDEPVQDTPKREVTQPKGDPDYVPPTGDRKPAVVVYDYMEISEKVREHYRREDWKPEEWSDLYTGMEGLKETLEYCMELIYDRKFTDAQRASRDKLKGKNK